MKHIMHMLIAALLATSALLITGYQFPGGIAHATYSTTKLQTYCTSSGYYCFYNYDFSLPALQQCSSTYVSNTNVDNAITLILYHNATQNNITNMLNWAGYTGAGSNECSVMYDYSDGYLNTWYLSTPGQKTTAGCNITDYHIRQYGSYYDPNWGYFAIASTHKDYSDGSGCSGSDYGYQEEAEHHIGNDLWNANNCGAFSPPCVNAIYWDSNSGRALNNAEDGTQCGDRTYGYGWRPDTSHCEQSDGYASTLDVH